MKIEDENETNLVDSNNNPIKVGDIVNYNEDIQKIEIIETQK